MWSEASVLSFESTAPHPGGSQWHCFPLSQKSPRWANSASENSASEPKSKKQSVPRGSQTEVPRFDLLVIDSVQPFAPEPFTGTDSWILASRFGLSLKNFIYRILIFNELNEVDHARVSVVMK